MPYTRMGISLRFIPTGDGFVGGQGLKNERETIQWEAAMRTLWKHSTDGDRWRVLPGAILR